MGGLILDINTYAVLFIISIRVWIFGADYDCIRISM